MQNYMCLCWIRVLYLIHCGTKITERYTTLKKHLIQEHYSVHTERPNQVRPVFRRRFFGQHVPCALFLVLG